METRCSSVPSLACVALAAAMLAGCGQSRAATQTPRASSALSRIGAVAKQLALAAQASSQPTETLGDCGGKVTLPQLSSSEANNSGTVSFASYCTVDTSTGNRVTVDGDLTFATSGTESGGTAVITRATADAPMITVTVADSAGRTLETASLGFAGFEYDNPPAASGIEPPETLRMALLVATTTTRTESRSIQLENLDLTTDDVAGGGTEVTGSLRLYRSETGYTDIAIDSAHPIVLDSSFELVAGGRVRIAGANDTSATLTITSASPLTISSVVNGSPSATRLTCSDATLPTL